MSGKPQKIAYAVKTWKDTELSGTPLTAEDLQRYEDAISILVNEVNDLQKMNT